MYVYNVHITRDRRLAGEPSVCPDVVSSKRADFSARKSQTTCLKTLPLHFQVLFTQASPASQLFINYRMSELL